MNRPHLITVERQTSALDVSGQPLDSWQEYRKLWVAMKPLAGRELALAKEMHADVNYRMDARYVSGITPAMRVSYGDRSFNILSVLNVDEKSNELQIFCREIVN